MHLTTLVALAGVLLAAAVPVEAQDRARTKEVIVGFAAEPRSLLPNTIVDWTTNNQLEHMYDRLVDRDAKGYKPAPMLATGWKVVNDTTWEFTLRQGVKFHNGEPFNAASVKATMDYIKDPANKTHYAPRWAQVKDVQVVNDYTVRFITEKPWPGLIDRIAATDFLPMPPKALKEQGVQALAAKPIGTGPFKFVQWVRDEKLVMEKNPDYWQGAPDLNRVTIRFIPEFSARLAALLAGEIDIMKDVPPHTVEMLDKSGKAKVRSTVSSRINYLALVNLKPGPMQDLRVRQAIHHAVERRRADPAGAQGPRHQDVRVAVAAQRGLLAQGRVHQVRSRPGAGPVQGSGDRSDQAPAHAGHPVRALPARQGRLPRHRRPAPAHRHQGQRGGERVGHAPRQDQEPHDRRHVLPRLGARARGAGNDRAALPGHADLLVLSATTRPSTPRSPRP